MPAIDNSSTESKKQYKYTFKLKGGSFHDFRDGEVLVVESGDLLHTDDDMIALEGPDRWELIAEGHETTEDLKSRIAALEAKLKTNVSVEPKEAVSVESENSVPLAKKSIKELRKMAAEMDPPVDLTTCTGKDEIVAAIQQAIDAA